MNIYLDSVGCRLNQSEIETFARQFRAAGHHLVASPDLADLVVVNTCTVTAAAASDSRQRIRQAARSGSPQVVATGCWATLETGQAASLPGVSQVITNLDKDRLVPIVLGSPPEVFDLEFIERYPVPGARQRTRAFIKVQDGCDNRCTFCITTLARGDSRSRLIPEVLSDVRAALRGGAQEIVLTGVHLGAWGADLQPVDRLEGLVLAILAGTTTPRLRLSSLEPWDLQPGFFDLWQDPRLCHHLHLPLQSGCTATLRRMARKTTPDSFAALLQGARAAIPHISITTDIIVGFPGETEAEFAESLEFVRQMRFAGGHVFTYSERPGTAAARMPGHVPHPERKARNLQMQSVLAESESSYQQAFMGMQLDVLWESAAQNSSQDWVLSGLTGNYLRVHAHAPTLLWNQITPVKLTALSGHGLVGTVGS
jgi:threonylcarbamoyladenosine tRNA methylthiotransferase MtaB